MQELIEKIQYSIDVQSGVSLTETQVNTLKTVMLVAENLLEKEKEQIVNAYDRGYKACDLDEALEINKTMFSGERYYNQTYNQNK